MSHIIEPCCNEKQLTALLSSIEGKSNVAHFYSFSDWTTSFLLPFFANRTPGGEVTLCLVQIDTSTLETIRQLMNAKTVDKETRESIYVIRHLSLITRGDNRAQVLAALQGFGDRLSICEDSIGFRCLTCANKHRQFVVQGSINQQMMNMTQLYTVTTGQQLYNEVQGLLNAKVKAKAIPDWESAYTRITQENPLQPI